ncbi:uncharacterized protein F5147DRAFT_780308 [Suillus discolor]|uniref:Uncharacterized protein n=1 Tax=Suillus discolor TaxID=1912936 RepID=A0A9P7JMH4_9AGAM|nr:uncharacterized protein F5147DRAFT_780308 [Suillus discolor]KAG2090495.1 hypothetical protein F5147DRAFT_780308 [Suillus discolor]
MSNSTSSNKKSAQQLLEERQAEMVAKITWLEADARREVEEEELKCKEAETRNGLPEDVFAAPSKTICAKASYPPTTYFTAELEQTTTEETGDCFSYESISEGEAVPEEAKERKSKKVVLTIPATWKNTYSLYESVSEDETVEVAPGDAKKSKSKKKAESKLKEKAGDKPV